MPSANKLLKCAYALRESNPRPIELRKATLFLKKLTFLVYCRRCFEKGTLFRTPLNLGFEPATRRVWSEHFTTAPRGSSYAKVLANKLNSPSGSDCASPVNYLAAKSETRRKESGGTLPAAEIYMI